MHLYYFIHATGRDPGNTGIQRVVRGLGRALAALGGVALVPVRWCFERQAIVHAEQVFLDTLALHNGPVFAAAEHAGEPIDTAAGGETGEPRWLLVPEVPHLGSHDARYPSVAIVEPLAHARRHGLRTAVVFHDLLPLTHREINGGDEAERLNFTIYAQGLINADLILPVSRATGALLAGWFADAGYRGELWPRLAPIELPEEIAGWPRRVPDPEAAAAPAGPIEFTSFGTICPRKNQLALLEAFDRLTRRHPELPVVLHLVGHCQPALVSRVAHRIRRSGGRAHVHGFLADDHLVPLIARSRATVFVSLAEGYGLPVAESLWLGTPCLCSDIGPMAEIAEGGGCLTVDPSDVAAIAAGIERLATDEACHRRLLAELAARQLRTWQDYASAVVAELGYDGLDRRALQPEVAAARLAAEGHRRPLPSTREVSMNDANAAVSERWFTIAAADLSCRDAYLGGDDALRRDGVIEFAADRHAAVAEEVLFHGPYITVDPGVYLFTFDGELDGPLTLRLTHQGGKPIRELTVDSFAKMLCVPLTGRYEAFEIVGVRTAALKSMRLASIRVHHIDPAGSSD